MRLKLDNELKILLNLVVGKYFIDMWELLYMTTSSYDKFTAHYCLLEIYYSNKQYKEAYSLLHSFYFIIGIELPIDITRIEKNQLLCEPFLEGVLAEGSDFLERISWR